MNRVNEITFNASLLQELRAIDFVHRLLRDGRLQEGDYRDIKVHIIEARKQMRPLKASSKLDAEWRFLVHLRDIGCAAAERWIDRHFDALGKRSTVDLREMFAAGSSGRGGRGKEPHSAADAARAGPPLSPAD